MSENEKLSHSPSAGVESGLTESGVTESHESKRESKDFEERLAGLPEKYRDEILRQYDIPETKVSLLAVLRYATLFEKLLMIIGTLMAIASGISHSNVILTCRRRDASNDCYFWRLDKCIRRLQFSWFNYCYKRPDCQ